MKRLIIFAIFVGNNLFQSAKCESKCGFPEDVPSKLYGAILFKETPVVQERKISRFALVGNVLTTAVNRSSDFEFVASTRLKLHCSFGMRVRDGLDSIVCFETGYWSGKLGNCQSIICPLPAVSNTTKIVNIVAPPTIAPMMGIPPTSFVEFECLPGFHLKERAKAQIFCLDEGIWSHDPPECEPTTSEPTLQNLKLSPKVKSVRAPRVPRSQKVRKDRKPKVEGCLLPLVQIDYSGRMEEIEVPTGVEYDPRSGMIPVGSKLKYACITGYNLGGGPSSIECQPSGSWTHEPPYCLLQPPQWLTSGRKLPMSETLKVECVLPQAPDNGVVIAVQSPITIPGLAHKKLFEVGHRIAYECDDGYVLNGAKLSHCVGNGRWSSPTPTCIPLQDGSNYDYNPYGDYELDQDYDHPSQKFVVITPTTTTTTPSTTTTADLRTTRKKKRRTTTESPATVEPETTIEEIQTTAPIIPVTTQPTNVKETLNRHMKQLGPGGKLSLLGDEESDIGLFDPSQKLDDECLNQMAELEPVNDIHQAVLLGKSGLIGCMIKGNPYLVETRGQYGRTPLMYAADVGDVVAATVLIKNGANLEARDDDTGATALALATLFGRTNMVKILLESSANPNNPAMNTGESVLDIAVDSNRTDLAKILLDAGANPEGAKSGLTPLHIAVERRNMPMVFLLMNYSANVLARREETRDTPIQRALALGYIEVAQVLLEGVLELKNKDGEAAIHVATTKQSKESVELLLTNGAFPNSRGMWGRTPLHYAAALGNVDICLLLVGYGANLNVKDVQSGATPLHLAAHFGHGDVVTFLVNQGADLHAFNDYGRVPKDVAVDNDKLGIARYLSSRGG